MQTKAILLDAGGVYFKGTLSDFVNKAYKMLKVKDKLKTSEKIILNNKLVGGKITVRKYFRDYFNVPVSNDQMKKLIELWNRTWIIDKEMIKLVKLLKKNYILALFSNLDKNNDKIYRGKGWYDCFDHLILSFKLSAIKPYERIYRIALKKLELKPEECLFVDDQQDCLIPAEKLGMKTLLFKSPSKLKKDLKRMKII